MSNKDYSPEALARRKERARKYFKKKYANNKEFRASEHERHKKRYHENIESERARSKAFYERNKEYYRFLGRTWVPESADIHSATQAYRFGDIDFDEFNRRLSSALARFDERLARESTASRDKEFRSRPRDDSGRYRRRNSQDAPIEVGCDSITDEAQGG